jgi:hypothetical protein
MAYAKGMNAHLSNKMVESIVAAVALDRRQTKRLSGRVARAGRFWQHEANS